MARAGWAHRRLLLHDWHSLWVLRRLVGLESDGGRWRVASFVVSLVAFAYKSVTNTLLAIVRCEMRHASMAVAFGAFDRRCC